MSQVDITITLLNILINNCPSHDSIVNHLITYLLPFESLFLLFLLDIGRKKLIKKVRMNFIFLHIPEKMHSFWISSSKDSFVSYNVFQMLIV